MRADWAGAARDLITAILRASKLQTMKGIYERVEGGPDGRIRTSLSPVGTETGRLSSSATFLEVSTNLQNIPKKTAKLDPLYDVRSVIVPDLGQAFVEGDLSQAEARATSAFANDTKTLEVFASGQDIHRMTASKIFGVPLAGVTEVQRFLGKMARHALNYGMGWKKFMEAINKEADLTGVTISAVTAKAVVDGYHRDNPALLRWWREVEGVVRRRGWLENPFGRRYHFVDMSSSAVNSWIAFLPQSTVADHLNERWCEVVERMDPKPLRVLLQIHDAILGAAEAERVKEVGEALRALMQHPIQIEQHSLLIPADVSWSATSWGEMKELKP